MDEIASIAGRARRALWHRWPDMVLQCDIHRGVPRLTERMEVSTMQLSSADRALRSWAGADMLGLYEQRFQAGQWCFVARVGEKIVHSCWAGTGPWRLDDIGILVNLGADEAYIYDAVTAPLCRGLGIFPMVAVEILRFLRTRGCGMVYARVDLRNRNSLASCRRIGFQPILDLTTTRLFNSLFLYTVRLHGTGTRSRDAWVGQWARLRPGMMIRRSWSAAASPP